MPKFDQIPLANAVAFDNYLHRPLVVTNESQASKTLEVLSEQPTTGNTILGVGIFQTLDIVATRGSKSVDSSRSIEKIIIFDRGPRVEHFWIAAEQIIKESDNRLIVTKKIKELLRKEAPRYFKECNNCNTVEEEAAVECGALDSSIVQNLSWLSSDKKFQCIKSIFDQNHFIFRRVDLFNPDALEVFRSLMKENNIVLDSIYLSNLGEYCSRKEESSYKDGISKILSPTTYVITAHSFSCSPWDTPRQYVLQKKDLSMDSVLFVDDKAGQNAILVPIKDQKKLSNPSHYCVAALVMSFSLLCLWKQSF